MSRHCLFALTLCCVAFAFVVPARAEIIIDSFDNGGRDITAPALTISAEPGPISDVFKGTRDYRIEGGGADLSVNLGSSGDVAFNQDLSGGLTRLIYDGTADGFFGVSGPGFDLTEASSNWGLRLDGGFVTGSPLVTITLTDTNSNSSSSSASAVNGVNIFNFGTFAGTADLTDIATIQLAFSGNSTDTATFSGFSTIPEPSTIGLLGMAALGGVWFARRRKKNQQTEAAEAA